MKRLALLVLALFTLVGAPAMAVEEPPFTVGLRAGQIEVRDYPALIAAEVSVGGDRGAAVNAGFRLLAGYIFGGNVRKQSIAMTAPVVQARGGGVTIPMTAPVVQRGAPGAWVVQFIMPRGSTLAGLPTPNDSRVRLRALPPARMAVARFSGLAGDGDIRRETATLEAFLAQHHLRATGKASLARYDPPWTPWFMRRNEIWIPVVS
jgi:hypothetical protein